MVYYKEIIIKYLSLLLVLVFVCMGYDFQFVSGEIRCLEKERDGLLRFKEGLRDDYGVLSSWGSGDEKKECCGWFGVQCSNTTNHVTGLLLGSGSLGGNLSSALLEFHHLNVLDLSGNSFGEYQIPEFITSMKQLRHLYLNTSSFSGIIPPRLGNLTNMRTLDLSSNNLRSDNLYWLSHLSLLTRLDLSYSNISDTNWLHQVVKLQSLQELSLQGCNIVDATFNSGLFVNSSNTPFYFLDLSDNALTSSTFDWLFNISSSLVKLDISSNRLDGAIPPALDNFIFLEYLDLSSNALVGGIPKSLWNLSHLQTLRLFINELGGPLEESFGKQSCEIAVSLETVDLSSNKFTASLPDLSKCFQLRELYLSNNKLNGSVSESVGQLSKLEHLIINSNSLVDTISEAHFRKLHNLKRLGLSFNSLTLDLSPNWIPPFQLELIDLARCKMGPSFPKWLQTQTSFSSLDLSSTGISDKVPKWLWNFSHSIDYFNLSNNQISGTIPGFSSYSINLVDVSSNKFSGPVPLFHPDTRFFQLSQNMFSGPISSICSISSTRLQFLDLSNNQLGGVLPNCWENLTYLFVLNLNNNDFSGAIPHAFDSLVNLLSLHLGGNNLSGEFPSALKNCQSLQLIDIGGNKLTGNIPSWLGQSYPALAYLSLRQNKFYGYIPPGICNLAQIQMLDLSENNLSGKIPQCFNNFTLLVDKNKTTTNWIFNPYDHHNGYIESTLVQWKGKESEYNNTLGLLKLIDLSSNRLVGDIPTTFCSLRGLVSLNLSRNDLTGTIDSKIGQMETLDVLDLSRNQLSGEIPIGLAQLHFLAILDLSYNSLSGKIPLGTQLQSFSPSAYAGNSKLCGLPLPLCPGHPVPSINNTVEDGDSGYDNEVWFLRTSFFEAPWISVIVGFIFGFWGIVGSLVLKKSWRIAYFSFWDDIGDWLYVTTTIFLRKLKRN